MMDMQETQVAAIGWEPVPEAPHRSAPTGNNAISAARNFDQTEQIRVQITENLENQNGVSACSCNRKSLARSTSNWF